MPLLKRLELNGFKSFAQKTIFEFPKGITAIVGPNGSGKSNIIDAVRWLLGEREAKNLRGSRVEDLIFAGTPKRPRLGQAQASLHFENEGNFFPLEFNEITVMRQVSRDGSNNYFLNRAEIRLKDLIDFFAQARLGTKGLVVVTQGNSDVFVRASAANRREMLEEMLGLREYQLKKNEAERRLKNTYLNLEKVEALIKEILPHLRSLKRQTHRWEKRELFEKELRELENRFFGTQWHKFKEDIHSVEKEISERRQDFDKLQKEKESAEHNFQKVETEHPQDRQEMTKIRNKVSELLEKRSGLQKELGRLEARLEIAQNSGESVSELPNQKLLEVIKEVRSELESSAEKGIDELRLTIKSIINKFDSILEPKSKTDADKKPLADENSELQLKKIKNDLTALDEETAELQEREKKLESGQEEFYQIFKTAVAAVELAKNKIEKWQQENQQRLFERERLELRFQELKRQIVQVDREPEEFENYQPGVPTDEDWSVLEKRIFKLRGDLASIGEIDEALVKEAKEMEERYQFLEQQLNDLEKAREDLKKIIADLSAKLKKEFKEALAKINEEFNKFFRLMFDGGRAKLELVRENKNSVSAANKQKDGKDSNNEEGTAAKTADDELEKEEIEGLEIMVNLPGKRINFLETLSGGERSLVGIAALFALISVSPPPFLVLDEIDASLDSRNSKRFSQMVKEFSKKTQFVIVTHNRAVMEAADTLYGITMNEDGTSKVLSLKLE